MSKVKQLKSDVIKAVTHFEEIAEYSSGKAYLARLRNSIGRPLSSSSDVMPIIFEKLSKDLIGNSSELNKEELAFLTTLQLYALSKQGTSTLFVDKELKNSNLGDSFGLLRLKDSGSKSVDRRFNALINANEVTDLLIHLRHMFKLLKSEKVTTHINYANLAADIYSFLLGYEENITIKWSRSYYSHNQKGEKENETK